MMTPALTTREDSYTPGRVTALAILQMDIYKSKQQYSYAILERHLMYPLH